MGNLMILENGEFQARNPVWSNNAKLLGILAIGSDGTVLTADSAEALKMKWAIPGGGSDPYTIVKLASDFITSLATDQPVTNFKFTPQANKTYLIYGIFILRTATATIGARPGISWLSGLTDGVAKVEASNSLTAFALREWGAKVTGNAASTGLATTTDSHFAQLDAMIIVGASPSGDFQITLASETAGTNVTMKAGSFFMYREI